MEIKILLFLVIACFLVDRDCFEISRPSQIILSEKDQAEMFFIFRADASLTFTLRQGKNTQPFYQNNTLLIDQMNEGQYERTVVEEVIFKAYIVLIKLTIFNVTNGDSATYICDMYKNGEHMSNFTQRVVLTVEYMPGVPSCVLMPIPPKNFGGFWQALNCVASIGSLPGSIICFQQREMVPYKSDPVQNSTSLIQQVWVKPNNPIKCCVSDFTGGKVGSCKDFSWELLTIDTQNHPTVSSILTHITLGYRELSTDIKQMTLIGNDDDINLAKPTAMHYTHDEIFGMIVISAAVVLILFTILIVAVIILIFKVNKMSNQKFPLSQEQMEETRKLVGTDKDSGKMSMSEI